MANKEVLPVIIKTTETNAMGPPRFNHCREGPAKYDGIEGRLYYHN